MKRTASSTIKQFEATQELLKKYFAKEALMFFKLRLMTASEAKEMYMKKMAKLEELAKKRGRKFSAKQLKIW